MRELQKTIIDEMGVKPTIDPAAEVERRVQFLCDYLTASHTKGFVLGISGGIDSTLAGRLAQLAVERLRSEGVEADFVAIRLPHGVQADEADAAAAMDWIAASTEMTINIKPATDGMEAAFEAGSGMEISDFNKGNVKARMRMVAQYAVAGDPPVRLLGELHRGEGRVVAADRDETRDVQAEERDDGVLEELRVLRRVRAGDADVRAAPEVDPGDLVDRERVDVLDVPLHEPLEAVADAEDGDALELGADRGRADDAVDAGRRSAADEDRHVLVLARGHEASVRRGSLRQRGRDAGTGRPQVVTRRGRAGA